MRIRAGLCLATAAYAVTSALVLSPAAEATPDCSLGQPAGRTCADSFCPSGVAVTSSGECGSRALYPPAQAEPAPPPLIGVI